MRQVPNFAGQICLERLLELANELRTAIDSGEAVTVDGGAISAIDFAGIQMLLAAERRASQIGVTLRVEVPQHGALRDALQHYGYDAPAPRPFVEAA